MTGRISSHAFLVITRIRLAGLASERTVEHPRCQRLTICIPPPPPPRCASCRMREHCSRCRKICKTQCHFRCSITPLSTCGCRARTAPSRYGFRRLVLVLVFVLDSALLGNALVCGYHQHQVSLQECTGDNGITNESCLGCLARRHLHVRELRERETALELEPSPSRGFPRLTPQFSRLVVSHAQAFKATLALRRRGKAARSPARGCTSLRSLNEVQAR
ncbi:hypothetical protein BDN71DRAFT_708427 [Pleurotus eryngii]|uniref:Uncharacterized protein n=1 Tax=Pleurotus eryngii TaxID=5323 RepID=A0A9P6A958_PLEER|nr:hypothetical protein BDN71DRAFT_708427 [Pleurotus eryngii]